MSMDKMVWQFAALLVAIILPAQWLKAIVLILAGAYMLTCGIRRLKESRKAEWQ